MVEPQPNTLVLPTNVHQYVLLVGGEDPRLVIEIMNEEVELCQEVVTSRGFSTYACQSRRSTPFTLGITGVGPSATEIAFVEYMNCGARVFVRAATSGGLLDTVKLGSVVIAKEALRYDGVSDLYVGRGFRAIADKVVFEALANSAATLGVEHSVGVTLTTAGFYAMGEITGGGKASSISGEVCASFEPRALANLRRVKHRKQALNIEMETATLLTLARIYGLKAGSVCGVSNMVPWEPGEQTKHTRVALRNAIRVGVEAIDCLYGRGAS